MCSSLCCLLHNSIQISSHQMSGEERPAAPAKKSRQQQTLWMRPLLLSTLSTTATPVRASRVTAESFWMMAIWRWTSSWRPWTSAALAGSIEPLLWRWRWRRCWRPQRRLLQQREQQSLPSAGGLHCGAQQVQSLRQQVNELDCTAFMSRIIVLIAIVAAMKVT